MTTLYYVPIFSLFLIFVGAKNGTVKWMPPSDPSDQRVDPAQLIDGYSRLGFSSYSRWLDDNNVRERVYLCYYSRKNPETSIPIKADEIVAEIKENIHKPFKLIIHGFLHSERNAMTVELKKQLLKFHDVNVINVDWSPVSRQLWYFTVAERTEIIGRYVAKLLDSLIREGAKPEDIHLIGHSLGAHVAGQAGSNTKGGKIGRITGLDPALPAFQDTDANRRLDPTDAEFVDCIHTCGGILGFMAPICQADFYPNGGRNVQPGCLVADIIGSCSHLRAPKYFQESIDPRYKFPAALCPHIPRGEPVECVWSDYNMGYYLDPSARGIFYTVTNYRPPYSLVEEN